MKIQINIEIPDDKWKEWMEKRVAQTATMGASVSLQESMGEWDISSKSTRVVEDSFLQVNTEIGQIITHIRLE